MPIFTPDGQRFQNISGSSVINLNAVKSNTPAVLRCPHSVLQGDFIPKVVEQNAVVNVAIGIAHINGHILICIGVGFQGVVVAANGAHLFVELGKQRCLCVRRGAVAGCPPAVYEGIRPVPGYFAQVVVGRVGNGYLPGIVYLSKGRLCKFNGEHGDGRTVSNLLQILPMELVGFTIKRKPVEQLVKSHCLKNIANPSGVVVGFSQCRLEILRRDHLYGVIRFVFQRSLLVVSLHRRCNQLSQQLRRGVVRASFQLPAFIDRILDNVHIADAVQGTRCQCSLGEGDDG